MSNEIKPSADYSDFVDEYNALIHIINSVVNKVKTIELVKVLSVNTTLHELSVIPIVKNANANGDAVENTPTYGVKYFEWQYGANSIVAVPEVGDIGICLISHKDISNIASGLVGSFRKFCESDSIYLGGLKGFNQTPKQFIEFNSNGINITSDTAININCDKEINITSATDLTINANSATINATEINLGSGATDGIARIGDTVSSNGVVIGQISSGSTTVKAL